jgi:DUF438 domain-containing protein
MAKTYHTSNRWALTGLFKRINLGDDPKLLRNEAHHLISKVDSADVAAAKQTLIDEGYPCPLVEKISEAFTLMGRCKENTLEAEHKLADNHILKKIMAEHNLIRCFLEDLRHLEEEIQALEELTDVSSEFRRLARIVVHFVIVKEHMEREEDVIFPYLRKFGWEGLCRAAENQHIKIRDDINNLVTLITSFNMVKFENVKGWLQTIVPRFLPTMLEHLAYEDELLWPISLIIIEDEKVWEEIKAVSDEIGYCDGV